MSEESAMCAPPRLLRLPDVMARTGLCKTAIYVRGAAGTFPKHVPLGGRISGWVESEIDAWVRARINERDAA